MAGLYGATVGGRDMGENKLNFGGNMAVTIEICINNSETTTDKGRILENLAAKILRIQQYEVVNTISVTGIEIDVLAKHKISNAQILVECKAWDSTLPADVISKLLGNVYLRGVSAG